MYQNYYELTADPFRLSPGNQQCFPHASFVRAKSYLQYALHKHEGIVLLTGDPGMGKTSLISELYQELTDSSVKVVKLTCSHMSADELIQFVAVGLGLKVGTSNKAFMLAGIETILADLLFRDQRHTVLILDEAQALPMEALEQLRLLTNLNWNNSQLVQIMLVGQRNLRELVVSPQLEQLHQRVIVSASLVPLNEKEVEMYITHKLSQVGWKSNPEIDEYIFPLIHRYSMGIPRWVNLICSRLLLQGMVEESSTLGRDQLRQVLDDLTGEDLLPVQVRSVAETLPRLG